MTAVSVVSQGWQTYQKPPDLADSIICTCKWRPSCLLWTNHCFPPIPDQSPGEERQAPVLLVPGWALCWVCMNAVTTATGRLTTDIFFLNLIHPLTVLNLFHWFHVLNRRAWPPHASRVKLNVAERHLSKQKQHPDLANRALWYASKNKDQDRKQVIYETFKYTIKKVLITKTRSQKTILNALLHIMPSFGSVSHDNE